MSHGIVEKFEGWCELRGDCADIKSLIPTSSVDSSETDAGVRELEEDSASLPTDISNAAIESPPALDGAHCIQDNNIDSLSLSTLDQSTASTVAPSSFLLDALDQSEPNGLPCEGAGACALLPPHKVTPHETPGRPSIDFTDQGADIASVTHNLSSDERGDLSLIADQSS